MAAKEGSRLQQFKASFNAFQFEIESQPQPPKMVSPESIDDTGLQSLVKALQEEALVIRGELADWKHKAQENALLTTKLQAEVEGWRDRAAMSAGKGIVARRQLDDFAKQVKTLNMELQKWKEVTAEHEDGSSKLQAENKGLQGEVRQWMQKAEGAAKEVESVKSELNGSVKALQADLEKWKQLATSGGDESRLHIDELEHSVQDLRAEVEEWETSAELEHIGAKASERTDGPSEREMSLQVEIEDVKKKVISAEKEQEQLRQHYETKVTELQVEVEAWKKRAACIAEDGKHERLALEKKLKESLTSEHTSNEWRDGPSELEMSLQVEIEDVKKKVISAEKERLHYETRVTELQVEVEAWKKRAACIAEDGKHERLALEKKLKESLTSEHTSNEWRDGPSELEMSLQVEIEDVKKKVISAEKERLHYETRVTELQVEVEAWKKRAACIAEDGKHERLALEKKLKESLVKIRDANDFVAMERQRTLQELAGVQAELKDWKVIAADASEECSSLRVAFDNVTKELQVELAQWKGKAELEKSVKAELEKVVGDLENQVLVWKEKAESALAKNQEYADVVQTLDSELCLWRQRTHEGKSLQLELEEEQLQMKESLRKTQNELQNWKGRAVTILSLQEGDLCDITEGENDSLSVLESQLRKWKTRAQEGKSLQLELEEEQLQLKESLTKAQNELQNWKDRAVTILSLQERNLCDVNEEEDNDSLNVLESQLRKWKTRAQEGELLQLKLTETQTELYKWKQKAAVLEQLELEVEQLQLKESLTKTQNELQNWTDRAATILSLQEGDLCDVTEGENDSLSVLESQLRKWKTRAQEGELLQLKLTETQTELHEWKQKAAVVTLATESLKEELDCVIEEGKLEREELNECINELEVGCQLLQTQLKTSQADLKEWKDKAVAITLTTRSLLEELDFRIEEGLQEKQQFSNSITALKESVLGWKAKAAENESIVLELNSTLLETQTSLREWKERATSVAMATETLKMEIDCTLEDYRVEKEEFCNTIRELEAEVYEWKARAQDGVTVQRQLERALSEMERKKRPLLRAHKPGSEH